VVARAWRNSSGRDDGAGWTFRAPAATTIRRVEIGRNTAVFPYELGVLVRVV
jgi:hypothetical protein